MPRQWRRRPTTQAEIEARFWETVVVLGPDDCWTWTGQFGSGKDGVYGTTPDLKSARRGAHVVSWEIHNGSVPLGLCVLHTCDNPKCVNPTHLWVGTKGDNMRDCVAKGRHAGPYGKDPGEVMVTCSGCGKQFGVKPSKFKYNTERGFRFACSRECNRKIISESTSGANNPRYIDGRRMK